MYCKFEWSVVVAFSVKWLPCLQRHLVEVVFENVLKRERHELVALTHVELAHELHPEINSDSLYIPVYFVYSNCFSNSHTHQ